MAEPDRATLRARRRAAEAELAACAAVDTDIEAQIERLNAAKRRVAPVDEGVNGVRLGISWDREVEPWAGRRRRSFDEFVAHDVDAPLRTYASGASDVYSHICDRITELENQRHDNEGALGWIRKRLNDVQNSLDKLVN